MRLLTTLSETVPLPARLELTRQTVPTEHPFWRDPILRRHDVLLSGHNRVRLGLPFNPHVREIAAQRMGMQPDHLGVVAVCGYRRRSSFTVAPLFPDRFEYLGVYEFGSPLELPVCNWGTTRLFLLLADLRKPRGHRHPGENLIGTVNRSREGLFNRYGQASTSLLARYGCADHPDPACYHIQARPRPDLRARRQRFARWQPDPDYHS